MRIYLAGRYSRRRELLDYAEELRAMGHEIVSSWLDGHHEAQSAHGTRADAEADDSERATWAAEDLYDLWQANCVVVFTHIPEGGERGGFNVELGWVLGYNDGTNGWGMPWGKWVILVGPRVNVFHCLDLARWSRWGECIEHYDDWPACLAALRQRAEGVAEAGQMM